ncbi:uncharacterized protein UHOD_12118 [Ustilago sp. UG-2017b]|nr:uncharacterized protein UHOD_12118 [Ustilago sp. UG-2017b]
MTRDINFARADLDEICNRAVSTTDLSELCCKSYDLPNSLIPALPSYELMDLPASCASSPMTNPLIACLNLLSCFLIMWSPLWLCYGDEHIPLSGNCPCDTGLGPLPHMWLYPYAPYPSDARDSSFQSSYHLIVTINPFHANGLVSSFWQNILAKLVLINPSEINQKPWVAVNPASYAHS